MTTCPVCEHSTVHRFMVCDGRHYLRCDRCQASFVAHKHLPLSEQERELYQLHNNDSDDLAYRCFLSRLSMPLLAALPPAQQGLDYGCGPGPVLARMLEEAGHHMTLYDPFFHDDQEVLGRQYDFITCTEAVEHFHQPSQEFRRLDSLLEPGGILAIMTCFQTDDARFANWHYRRDPTHVVFYREETFCFIACRFGWRCEIPCKDVVLLHKPQ